MEQEKAKWKKKCCTHRNKNNSDTINIGSSSSLSFFFSLLTHTHTAVLFQVIVIETTETTKLQQKSRNLRPTEKNKIAWIKSIERAQTLVHRRTNKTEGGGVAQADSTTPTWRNENATNKQKRKSDLGRRNEWTDEKKTVLNIITSIALQ